jgi:hypothetical protein
VSKIESRQINLKDTSFDSVFDAESEKIIFSSWKKEGSRKFCTFLQKMCFSGKTTLVVFRIFRPEGRIC